VAGLLQRSLLLLPLGAGAGACFDPQNLPELRYGVAADAVWRDGAPPVDVGRTGERRLIVTNNLDDTVSVVSWERLVAGGDAAEVARFPVGLVPLEREGPHHVAVSADGRFAFVGISNFVPGGGSGPHGAHGTGSADGRALRIDLATLRTVAATRVDRNPGDIRLSPDGTVLVLSHFDQLRIIDAANREVFAGPEVDARLALLDPATLERRRLLPLCPAPHGLAFTADGARIVSSCLSDEAAVVDVAAALAGSDTAVRRVTLLDEPGTAASPRCGPYAVTMSADDATAWVSCYSSGDLVAVDVATATRGPSLALPGLAVFGDVSEAGDRLAITTQDTDGVVLFDIGADNALQLTSFLPLSPDVCALPHTALFLDDDAHLAVVCEGDKRTPGRVIALEVGGGAVLGGVDVGLFPDDLALQVVP
jgi:DNA-binding beta-propeller fold protein YncE